MKEEEQDEKETEMLYHYHEITEGGHELTSQHRCAICGKDLQLENFNEYAFRTVIQNRVNICAECRKEHFKFECFS